MAIEGIAEGGVAKGDYTERRSDKGTDIGGMAEGRMQVGGKVDGVTTKWEIVEGRTAERGNS